MSAPESLTRLINENYRLSGKTNGFEARMPCRPDQAQLLEIRNSVPRVHEQLQNLEDWGFIKRVAAYEHNEIAEMLGCSIGTSKSQLHKAHMKLRRLLRIGSKEELTTLPEVA